MKRRHDDAGDEQGEGHAQQQSVKFVALREEGGKDAVERGHGKLRVIS